MAHSVQLQSLPPYVLQMVAWGVCNMDFRLSPGVNWEGPDFAALRPLLTVCRALRQPALLAILRNWNIHIDDGLSIETSLATCGLPIPECEYPVYARYARCVTLTVDAAAIASGSALRLVNSGILGAMCFVAASCVDLRLHFEGRANVGGRQAASRVSSLLQRLDAIIPRAQTIHMFVHQDGCFVKCEYSGSLVQLAQKVSGLLPESGALVPHHGRPIIMPNLTQIGCSWDENYRHMAHAIRMNADTLVVLQVVVDTSDDIQPLFTTAAGEDVTYPSLAHFKLHCRRSRAMPTASIHVRDTPFPSVVTMELDYYPFDSGAVFSNARSLERLRFPPSAQTLHILNQQRVLAKERLPRLHQVDITSVVSDDDDGNEKSQLVGHHLQMVFTLMQFVKEVCVSDTDVAEQLPAYLPGRPHVVGLQVLHLKYCNIGLEQLLGLIQMLPSLQTLKCPVVELGGDSQRVDSVSLASCMRAKFNMDKSQLQTWCITNDDVFPLGVLALFILVVADLCPLLYRIQFDRDCDTAGDVVQMALGSRLLASLGGRLAPALVEGSLPPMVYIKRRLKPHVQSN
ncbi:hypothetical protein H4R19_001750 [Coemansia spiralis]|nr:hypothetical protein H4R19_001750 [Coemansia spiralis]